MKRDVIVVQFITLDGVVSDPDGRWGTDHGGWAFRYGLKAVSDDKFRLGARQENGVQLYGRRTWEHFSRLWPGRDGDFAQVMNRVPKRVATRSGLDVSAWANSAVVEGDVLTWVEKERVERDVIVIGSLSLVRALAAADLVDEYRLLSFPALAGSGDRLFQGPVPSELRFTSVEFDDPAVLTVLRR